MALPVVLPAADGKPNILFLMADDWSSPHAGILGDPVAQTPAFDRVAREGVLFQNAFVSAPSCTPSRLAIATGQWHWRLQDGVNLGGSLREGENAGIDPTKVKLAAKLEAELRASQDPFLKSRNFDPSKP